jgi:hypothetical protein
MLSRIALMNISARAFPAACGGESLILKKLQMR